MNFYYSILIKGSFDVRSLIAPLKHPRGALVAHRNSLAHPRCKTSQYRRSFIPLSVSLWNDLSDPMFDGEGLAGFKSMPMLSCWHDLLFLFWLLLIYLFIPSMGWLCGVGVSGLIECSHSLPALHSGLQMIVIVTMSLCIGHTNFRYFRPFSDFLLSQKLLLF